MSQPMSTMRSENSMPRLRSSLFAGMRILLGFAFLFSSVGKLQSPYEFLVAVYNYEIAGREAGVVIASILPWLELIVGCSLILELWVLGASLVASVMLFTFFLAQSIAYFRDATIPCGCVSVSDDIIGVPHLARTGALLIASVVCFTWALKKTA